MSTKYRRNEESKLGTYKQHIDAMDLALANPSGVQLRLPTHGQAMRFRQMCYQARRVVEREHDTLPWQDIVISVDDNLVVLRTQESIVLEVIPLDGITVRSRFDPEPDRELTPEEKMAKANSLLKGEEPKHLMSIAMTAFGETIPHKTNKRHVHKEIVQLPEVAVDPKPTIDVDDVIREMTIDAPIPDGKLDFE